MSAAPDDQDRIELGARPPAEAAWTTAELYRRHAARLRGLAAAITLDRSAAEEVVHDAFAELEARRATVVNPAAYLQRSVVHASLRVIRHRDRWRRLPAEVARHAPAPEVDETWGAVARLPARQRAVVVLRFWQDLSYQQIADVLDVPLGTVQSTLHRALRSLKEELS